jgi:hypothetical protein
MTTDPPELSPRQTAYVRTATDHPERSASEQMALIRRFAERRGLRIAKVYSDHPPDSKGGNCPEQH